MPEDLQDQGQQQRYRYALPQEMDQRPPDLLNQCA